MIGAPPEPDTDPERQPDPDPPTPRSARWEKIRQQHEEISSEHEPFYLELPAPYEGVYVRYKYVPLAERKGSMKNIAALEDETEQSFWGCVDIIRDACDEMMCADPDDPRAGKDPRKGDYLIAPLCDEGDPPLKFDRPLARHMEWKDAHLLSGRQIVRKMFGGEQGDYLLMEHARKVGKWMGAERVKRAEDLAGK